MSKQENIYYWDGQDKIAYLDVKGDVADLPSPQFVTTAGKRLFKQCPLDPNCVITKDGQHIVLDPEGEKDE